MQPVCVTVILSERPAFATSSTNVLRTGLAPAAMPQVAMPTTTLMSLPPSRSTTLFCIFSLIAASSANVFMTFIPFAFICFLIVPDSFVLFLQVFTYPYKHVGSGKRYIAENGF